VVPSGGRGYLIVGHWNFDIPELRTVSWESWFHDVLATVRLEPENAVDSK
jgi:hypothetical protein